MCKFHSMWQSKSACVPPFWNFRYWFRRSPKLTAVFSISWLQRIFWTFIFSWPMNNNLLKSFWAYFLTSFIKWINQCEHRFVTMRACSRRYLSWALRTDRRNDLGKITVFFCFWNKISVRYRFIYIYPNYMWDFYSSSGHFKWK